MRYGRGFPRQNLNQLDPQTGKITQARPLPAPIVPSHRDFRRSAAETGSIRVTEAAGYLCPPIDCARELVRCIVQHTVQRAMPIGWPAAADPIVEAADDVMV